MLQSDNFCEIILLCLLKFYSNQHLNFFFNLNFFEESLNSKTLKTDIFFKEFFSFFIGISIKLHRLNNFI